MKFRNLGKDKMVRLGQLGKSHQWMEVKSMAEVDLPEDVGTNYGFLPIKSKKKDDEK